MQEQITKYEAYAQQEAQHEAELQRIREQEAQERIAREQAYKSHLSGKVKHIHSKIAGVSQGQRQQAIENLVEGQ